MIFFIGWAACFFIGRAGSHEQHFSVSDTDHRLTVGRSRFWFAKRGRAAQCGGADCVEDTKGKQGLIMSWGEKGGRSNHWLSMLQSVHLRSAV